MNYENEVWKPVVGYEGHYEVSDMGRVRSLKRKKIKYIKPYLSSEGYYKFSLYLNSKLKQCSAHRIIYEAFVKQIDEGLAIDHINGIRTDNRIANLREATWYQNSIYGAEIRRNAGKTSSMYLGVDKIHSRGIAYYRVRHLRKQIAIFRCEHIAGFVAKMVRDGVIPPEPFKRTYRKNIYSRGKA
jgi:hypothetical protein